MKKTTIAGVVLAGIAIYALMNGKWGFAFSDFVQTWVPLGAAAYIILA